MTQAAQTASRRLSFPARDVEWALFACAVAVAAALPWVAPRPPMVDLPQHAAQVALWRDLILGVTPFADELRVNLATPYLVGYGLALPFAFFLAPATALKIVLSGALLGFVAAGRGLRRELDADPRLDWLWLAGVFGFAWHWGFFTFLVAAPLALLVARLQLRHAATPDAGAAARLAAAGAALLLCHGLLFLFALVIGGFLGLFALAREGLRGALRRAPPYVALLAALALFMLARILLAEPAPAATTHFGEPLWERPFHALAHVWSAASPFPALALAPVALAAPWLMGLRPDRPGGVALFAAAASVVLFAPDMAFATGFLQQRFALFLLPFYALMFGRPADGATQGAPARGALMAAVAIGLGLTGARAVAFSREEADFEQVMAAAEPGRRALTLVFDRASAAADSDVAYLHWPAWYQADRGGFVDFNFAQFHPQVVRLKRDAPAPVDERRGWTPEAFDWAQWDGARYGYIFLRGDESARELIRARLPCTPRETAAGAWLLIDLKDCAAQPAR
jgi:hypothetical protein